LFKEKKTASVNYACEAAGPLAIWHYSQRMAPARHLASSCANRASLPMHLTWHDANQCKQSRGRLWPLVCGGSVSLRRINGGDCTALR
jgi:hypothetical protein